MATLRVAQELAPDIPWFEVPWPSRWTWLCLGSFLGLFSIYKALRYADTLKELRLKRERIRARQMRIAQAAVADPELQCVYDVAESTVRDRAVAVSWRIQVQGCACFTPLEDIHSSPSSDPAVLWLASRNYHPHYICTAAGEIQLVISGQARYALTPGWAGPALGELACACVSLWNEGEATLTSRCSNDLAELLDVRIACGGKIRVGCIDAVLARDIASEELEPILLPQEPCISLFEAADDYYHLKEASRLSTWKDAFMPRFSMLRLWQYLLPDTSYISIIQRFFTRLHSFQLLCSQYGVTTLCFTSEHGAGLTRPGLSLGSVYFHSTGRVSVLGRPTSCLATMAALERKLLG